MKNRASQGKSNGITGNNGALQDLQKTSNVARDHHLENTKAARDHQENIKEGNGNQDSNAIKID